MQQASSKGPGEILIVEDVAEAALFLAQLLGDAGYRVRQAPDGELAILSVRARAPDLILLDIRLPRIDGFEVCRRLKADPQTAEIPLIFLSALKEMDSVVAGFGLGAVDYISKPFHAEEILARVRTQLELGRLRQGLEQLVRERTAQLLDEIAERKQTERQLRESRQKLRELSGYLEDIREQERARIARELHDELGQALTVLRIDLVRLANRLAHQRDMTPQQIHERLATLIGILDQIADSTRSISENLRPGMLDVLGLGAAIEHHVGKFAQSTGVQCQLAMNQSDFPLDDRSATTVFRLLQEALTNVARHAQAQRVEIQLVGLEKEVLLVEHDDGRGIQSQGSSKRSSYGMLGMRERVGLLGGNLLVESEPGKGTRIEASIPYPAAGEGA